MTNDTPMASSKKPPAVHALWVSSSHAPLQSPLRMPRSLSAMTEPPLPTRAPHTASAVVIGAGPAGLMAAESIAATGGAVDVYDAMPSVARKLLIAGVGGLNITHSEPFEAFVARYRDRASRVRSWLEQLNAGGIRDWAKTLGIDTFVGSSGRVFPTDMKAAPLLRAWLRRLRRMDVQIHLRHRWQGFANDGALQFQAGETRFQRPFSAAVLALGGGSWSRLGADGRWVDILSNLDIAIAPLQSSNCGFDVDWSDHFRERFAGEPVKAVRASIAPSPAAAGLQGEFVISTHGIEGSLIYALCAELRERLHLDGKATLNLDLAPGRDLRRLELELAMPRGRRTLSEHLRRHAGIEGVKANLLYELSVREHLQNPVLLAGLIKCLPVQLQRTRPLDEAISSAGGVRLEALNPQLMLNQRPGVFCAGEMLDWDAPTGGYLLTACLASGRVAGAAAASWLRATSLVQGSFENPTCMAHSSPTTKEAL